MGFLDLLKRLGRRRPDFEVDISDRVDMIREITELCRQRKSVEVILVGTPYSSFFLDMLEDAFIIDVLMPRKGNELLRPETKLKLHYFIRAFRYSTVVQFKGMVHYEGIDALELTLPDIIYYSNRRDYYRVTPHPNAPVRIIMDIGAPNLLEANARDFSGNGFAVFADYAEGIALGQPVSDIEIHFSGGSVVKCHGVVRRIRSKLLGIEITEIDGADRQQMLRYVLNRQKEQIAAGEISR